MGQNSLDSWGVEADDADETPRGNSTDDGAQERGMRADVKAYRHFLADNAEPDADDSCPWCCAPSDDFTTELSSDDSVACGNCSASIPVDEDWYTRGEKIII